MSNMKIFLTGGTGYIGGTVLTRLLNHPKRDTFDITVISRSAEKAEKLRAFGLTAVVASHADHDKLTELAAGADVVFTAADADDLGAAKAILAGMKARHDKTGKQPILIHTSGTGVLVDKADGMRSTDTIYHDADTKQMAALAPEQPHREVDIVIVEADVQGYVKAHLVLPSTIYGVATGPLFDAGAAHAYSQQIPALIRASLDRGHAGVFGEGKNFWPNVHIDEVADLYMVLFDHVAADPSFDGHGANGYYFGENGEHELINISKAIGQAMLALGKAKSSEPTTFTEAEIAKYFNGSKMTGANSRCRADHSRAIGWAPVKTTEDMLASVRPEVEAILAGK